jgi:hypothetical protein
VRWCGLITAAVKSIAGQASGTLSGRHTMVGLHRPHLRTAMTTCFKEPTTYDSGFEGAGGKAESRNLKDETEQAACGFSVFSFQLSAFP